MVPVALWSWPTMTSFAAVGAFSAAPARVAALLPLSHPANEPTAPNAKTEKRAMADGNLQLVGIDVIVVLAMLMQSELMTLAFTASNAR
jgi:hypothetical protein